jgi:hypothetical protein
MLVTGPTINRASAATDRATDGDLEWRPASAAPVGRDLELAVIDKDGTHTLVFPSRRIAGGWANAETNKRIDVSPTHWREWSKGS